MEINIAAAYEFMMQEVSRAPSTTTGMETLLDYCSRVYPTALWSTLRNLGYAEDEALLRQWLVSTFTQDPVPVPVKAFWFGLFNPEADDKPSCALYVSGSTQAYTPGGLDWACFRDDTYLPGHYVAESKVLHTIHCAIQQAPEAMPMAEYVLCLGYACLALLSIIRNIDTSIFPGTWTERAVVAGFDDGDCVLLGTLTEQGYQKPV
ncbi:hypothetical protein CCAX7_52330 [Capsulimonas corticalis]|uniref:Uncharacterized protein n=1 Tax=Capsulimonas corticalis TaxID=2219043 RepID=A0A402CNV2_9BACT|nr:hypothetical protein [Capsulimonas corticalis]BDI33182.1 hypothetical protein CCAX7_52330 [Capsulimonas corticalis]